MNSTFSFAIAAMLCSSAALATPAQSPLPVVAIHYVVTERTPERVEATVTNPLERALRALPRAVAIDSQTCHGSVRLEIAFDGGATERDLENVRQRIDGLRLDDAVTVTSRTASITTRRLPQWPSPCVD